MIEITLKSEKIWRIEMIEYGFIGTGNMAQAMIKGLLGKGVSAKNIAVYSPRSAAKLTEKWG